MQINFGGVGPNRAGGSALILYSLDRYKTAGTRLRFSFSEYMCYNYLKFIGGVFQWLIKLLLMNASAAVLVQTLVLLLLLRQNNLWSLIGRYIQNTEQIGISLIRGLI